MRIWGKVLGFLFGFMLTKNIVGALIGAWLGHLFDRGRAVDFNESCICSSTRAKTSCRQCEKDA